MNKFYKSVKYFTDSAVSDLETAKYLFQGRRYDSCLFFCHLALEKLLKAIVAETTGQPAPYTHFLTRLAEQADIKLTKDQLANLKTITKFNIAGRYDDEELAFHKLCTRPYAQKYLKITKELYLWLKENSLKK